VIDGTSNAVLATDSVSANPIAFGFNSTNNKIYVANYGGNSVSIIDGTSNGVIATLTGSFYYPIAFTYNPTNNRIYCANNSTTVAVIDGASNMVIRTIPVGAQANAILYNPTNNKVYTSNRTSNNVSVINCANDSVITHIGTGSEPNALAYNSQDNRIYVANNTGSTISVIYDGVGIEEYAQPITNDDVSIKIYPNPAKSFLTIQIPQITNHNNNENSLRMYDITGKLVKDINLSVARYSKEININISLQGIDSGVYFFKTKEQNGIQKLIISK
jgi:YVTN family beta-propeller protein